MQGEYLCPQQISKDLQGNELVVLAVIFIALTGLNLIVTAQTSAIPDTPAGHTLMDHESVLDELHGHGPIKLLMRRGKH